MHNNHLKTPHQLRVEQFMNGAEKMGAMNQGVPDRPTIPNDKTLILRAKLVMSEALEMIRGLAVDINLDYGNADTRGGWPVDIKKMVFTRNQHRDPDIVEVVDGCLDISVTTIGTLSAFGVADLPLLEAVDASNLSKLRGDSHVDADGKVCKPSDWDNKAMGRKIHELVAQQIEMAQNAESVDAT